MAQSPAPILQNQTNATFWHDFGNSLQKHDIHAPISTASISRQLFTEKKAKGA